MLEEWLQAAFHSGVPELRSFVNKLRQDQQAVQTGFVLKWNNGMVEGHVNRLKFLAACTAVQTLMCCGCEF